MIRLIASIVISGFVRYFYKEPGTPAFSKRAISLVQFSGRNNRKLSMEWRFFRRQRHRYKRLAVRILAQGGCVLRRNANGRLSLRRQGGVIDNQPGPVIADQFVRLTT